MQKEYHGYRMRGKIDIVNRVKAGSSVPIRRISQRTRITGKKTSVAKKKQRIIFNKQNLFLKLLIAILCAVIGVAIVNGIVVANTVTPRERVEAVKTNITGNVYPNYVPRGFTLSSFNAEPEKMTLFFENHETEESFVLTSENTTLTAGTILSDYVAVNYGKNYTIINDQEPSIYIDYDEACWVKNRVLYTLKMADGITFTKKQIKTIAASL